MNGYPESKKMNPTIKKMYLNVYDSNEKATDAYHFILVCSSKMVPKSCTL